MLSTTPVKRSYMLRPEQLRYGFGLPHNDKGLVVIRLPAEQDGEEDSNLLLSTGTSTPQQKLAIQASIYLR